TCWPRTSGWTPTSGAPPASPSCGARPLTWSGGTCCTRPSRRARATWPPPWPAGRGRGSPPPTTSRRSPTRSARSCPAPTRCGGPPATAAPTTAGSCAGSSRSTGISSPSPPCRRSPRRARCPRRRSPRRSPGTTSTPRSPTRPAADPDLPDPGRAGGTVATTEIAVPDIGDYQDVPVIEVHVAPGDVVAEEDPLVTLESDKATMDVPATAAGKVQDVRVKVGDTVSEGSVVVVVGGDGAGPLTTPPSLVDQQEPAPEEPPGAPAPAPAPAAQAPTEPPAAAAPAPAAPAGAIADISAAHAGPSVRRLARELGLDLTTIKGSGEKGRIVKDDLLAAVRGPPAPAAPAAPATAAGARRPARPAPGRPGARPPPGGAAAPPGRPARFFAVGGGFETVPLPRIKKLSGPFLH